MRDGVELLADHYEPAGEACPEPPAELRPHAQSGA